MTVAQPSSAASFFHLLRWQMKNPARKPLIVFEPKSMLRLKAAASKLTDFTAGNFKPFIGEGSNEIATSAERLILCSGKIYWELLAERARLGDKKTAIARVEQLYPLPTGEMLEEIKRFANAKILWVQDEPANQGPWPFVSATIREEIGNQLSGREVIRVSRRAAASPATGSVHVHEEEQKALLAEVFNS
jgi:2-oxoglutarate dehydrogenase E1 component